MTKVSLKRGAPRSQKSHEAILAAALKLADSGGPQALSTEAVAREAGVGKQTIYRWWPTRIELLIEVYDAYAPVQRHLDDQRPLHAVLASLFELYRTGPAGELLAGMIALSRSNPEAQDIFETRFRAPRSQAFADYLAATHFATPETAADTADLIVALVWHALLSNPERLNATFAERICLTAQMDISPSLTPFTIEEGYYPGYSADMIRLHMAYYATVWNLELSFERHLLRDFSRLMDSYDPKLDQLLRVTSAQAETLGTLAIDGSGQPSGHARVRFFIMDDRAKGQGLGWKMLTQALDTCRERGQTKLHLTTFTGLEAARTLYERAGFRLTETYDHAAWDGDAVEVRYDLDLNKV